MKNTVTSALLASSLSLGCGVVYGDCKPIRLKTTENKTDADLRLRENCTSVINQLSSTPELSDIFASEANYMFGVPGVLEGSVCYRSKGPVKFTIGSKNVKMKAVGIWITESLFNPQSVITRYKVSGGHKGDLYSKDLIYPETGTEIITFIGGTKDFKNATGNAESKFVASAEAGSPIPNVVTSTSLEGSICLPSAKP